MVQKLLLFSLTLFPIFTYAWCESAADCPPGYYCSKHSVYVGNYCQRIYSGGWPLNSFDSADHFFSNKKHLVLQSAEGTTVFLNYAIEESAGWTLTSQIGVEIHNPTYKETEEVVLELDNYRATELSPSDFERQFITSWAKEQGSFKGQARGIVLISDRPGETIKGQSVEVTVSGKKLTNPETGSTKFNLQLLKQ